MGAPIRYTKGSSNVRADMLSRIRVDNPVALIDADAAPGMGHTDPDHLDHRVCADGLDPNEVKMAQRYLNLTR